MGKSKHKKTRHHRKPRFHGGKRHTHNISVVPEHHHRAYHMLFHTGYPHSDVARVLNSVWLSADGVLVPIPTRLLKSLIWWLSRKGVKLTMEDLGIGEAHQHHLT